MFFRSINCFSVVKFHRLVSAVFATFVLALGHCGHYEPHYMPYSGNVSGETFTPFQVVSGGWFQAHAESTNGQSSVANGPIYSHLLWVTDEVDEDPPPKVVLEIRVECLATGYQVAQQNGVAANLTPNTYGSNFSSLLLERPGSTTIQVPTIIPMNSAASPPGFTSMVTTRVKVIAHEARINVFGITKVNGDEKCLVGQVTQPTLELGTINLTQPDEVTWNVSAAPVPFSSYSPDSDSASVSTLSFPLTDVDPIKWFRTAYAKEATTTIDCQVTIRSIPPTTLTVTLQKEHEVMLPQFEFDVMEFGEMAAVAKPGNPPVFFLQLVSYNNGQVADGMSMKGKVTTGNEFTNNGMSFGRWGVGQKVFVNIGNRVDDPSITYQVSHLGEDGHDQVFECPILRQDPGGTPTVSWISADGQRFGVFNDSPGASYDPVLTQSVDIEFQFATMMCYLPPDPPALPNGDELGAFYVPLKKYFWMAKGDLKRVNGVLVPSDASAKPGDYPEPLFLEWDLMVPEMSWEEQ